MAKSERSSGEAAYAAMLDALRAGVYQPGERLREEDVARQLALSRTPVREALRRMEAEGLIQHVPRQGATVRQLDHAQVVELYEMRVVLERTAAELAAKHGTEAEFETLEALNAQIAEERETPARAAAINQAFHRGIYNAARNRFLVQSAQALNNALILLGPTTYTGQDRVDEVVAQHEAIVAALRTGDQAAAGRAAEQHLQTSLRRRLRVLEGA